MWKRRKQYPGQSVRAAVSITLDWEVSVDRTGPALVLGRKQMLRKCFGLRRGGEEGTARPAVGPGDTHLPSRILTFGGCLFIFGYSMTRTHRKI